MMLSYKFFNRKQAIRGSVTAAQKKEKEKKKGQKKKFQKSKSLKT